MKPRYGNEQNETNALLTNRISNYKVPYPGYSFEFDQVDKYTMANHNRKIKRDNDLNKSQPNMPMPSQVTLEESTRIATTN